MGLLRMGLLRMGFVGRHHVSIRGWYKGYGMTQALNATGYATAYAIKHAINRITRTLAMGLSFLGLALLLTTGSPMTAQAEDLGIEILTKGDGATAQLGQRVTVHYEGRLLDGTMFDSSVQRGQPFEFTLGRGQVIKGWEVGVEGMAIGEKRKLTIPPEMGYGARGAGDKIPPNATLVFEVELLGLADAVVLGQATPDDLKKAQADGVVVIDIRREDEWRETGIIEGAETITAFTETGQLHPDFQRRFFGLVQSPETPIMLYCRTGNRTGSLGNALIDQLGFSNVTHLTDGIVGWKKDGEAVVNWPQ